MKKEGKILVVDDEEDILLTLRFFSEPTFRICSNRTQSKPYSSTHKKK